MMIEQKFLNMIITGSWLIIWSSLNGHETYAGKKIVIISVFGVEALSGDLFLIQVLSGFDTLL